MLRFLVARVGAMLVMVVLATLVVFLITNTVPGDPVLAPRMTDVPVRVPLPPAKRQGSIYETQSAAKKSYFTRAA